MDIGLTQLPSFNARSCLNAGTYGTMGVGLGQAIAACAVHPDRPVIHLSGDSAPPACARAFSVMEMEGLVRYNFPCKIVVLNNGGIGPGMPEIPDNPMFNMKPNSLIYGARYDRMMEAPGLRRGRPRRHGLLCRGPEEHSRRPRRSDEPPRPRPRQRRALARRRSQAAAVPLAQVIPGLDPGIHKRAAPQGAAQPADHRTTGNII